MSDTTYKFELQIVTNPDKSEKDKPTELLEPPVQAFEVDGGVNRKIEIDTTNEIRATSEFEQARNYKNIILYILPTKDFVGVKLIELRTPEIRFFNLLFMVSTYLGDTMIRTVALHCRKAWFRNLPKPVGSTPPLLKAEMGLTLDQLKLLHGRLDAQKKKLIVEEM